MMKKVFVLLLISFSLSSKANANVYSKEQVERVMYAIARFTQPKLPTAISTDATLHWVYVKDGKLIFDIRFNHDISSSEYTKYYSYIWSHPFFKKQKYYFCTQTKNDPNNMIFHSNGKAAIEHIWHDRLGREIMRTEINEEYCTFDL